MTYVTVSAIVRVGLCVTKRQENARPGVVTPVSLDLAVVLVCTYSEKHQDNMSMKSIPPSDTTL